MKILIAIKSCHQYHSRANAQRQTWIKDIPDGVDYKFFLGRHLTNTPSEDQIFLDAEDNYFGLPEKMKKACAWALEKEYDYVFFCDDDTYVVVPRLLQAIPQGSDYVGRLRGPSGNWPAPYCSGFAYWLSAKALKIVAETTLNLDTADDRQIGNMLHSAGVQATYDSRFVVALCDMNKVAGQKGLVDTFEDRNTGNTLLHAGVTPVPDYRYAVLKSKRNSPSAWAEPDSTNDLIAVCEFEPGQMVTLHSRVKTALEGSQNRYSKPVLNGRVTIMVKTMLRDGPLFFALDGIQKTLPDCKIVVVDDGIERPEKITRYARLREQGHTCIWLPFDTGFSRKANAAIPHCDGDFVLIGSDDFNFMQDNVASDINKMMKVLDHDPSVGFAAGRVNGVQYEWQWEQGEDWLKEYKGDNGGGEVDGVKYRYCDLTVNYGLVRRSILNTVHWDDTPIKIGGGEHAAWFIDLKRAGWRAAYVEGCNINESKHIRHMIDVKYALLRSRARGEGRPLLKVRGINRYTMGSGITEIS